MTDLIIEARELCEKAMALEIPTERLDYSTEYVPLVDAIHIIPELCDALEKAQGNLDAVWDMYQSAERELKKVQKQNKKLVHELSKLACESVKRDVALAKLEAEVAAAVGEGCDYCLSTWPERAADGFSDIWHGNKLSVGYGVYREISYCPMCGKRLEAHHEAD